MIEKGRRWSDTVCLRQTVPSVGGGQDPIGTFSSARCIDYSKSWTRALPRLAISLPITVLIALPAMGWTSTLVAFLPAVEYSPLIRLSVGVLAWIGVALVSFSIFWRPAISRNAKIELRRVLRTERLTAAPTPTVTNTP